jgi:hypothetical protein
VVSLGLNNSPRIGFTFVKSGIKKIRRRGQWNFRCKIAGTGIHSVVANRAKILRFATTGITPWQTALKCTAD